MITGKVIGAEQLRQYFKEGPERVTTGLTRAVTRLTMMLLRDVKENKLRGGVLNVQSGRLRRSINQVVTGQGTDQVQGSVGTNLSYGRLFEMGGTPVVSVQEHLRTVTQAFGRPIGPIQVSVKAHKMKMNPWKSKQRAFLKPALADLEPKIDAELQSAAKYIAKGETK